MQVLQVKETSSVTQKGQVTIPVSLRKKLGIKPGAKVAFEEGHDHIKLKPLAYSLESAHASIPRLKRKLSIKEVRRIALEDKIQKDKVNEARRY